METQCQKRYPTTFRPELHQSPVPLGFCYAKHGNRATRGQHCTLSVRNSALHPTSLEHRACHDANIAPWLLLANRLGLQASRQDLKSTDFYLSSDCAQVRWLEVKGGEDNSTCDELVVGEDIVDSRTRLVSSSVPETSDTKLLGLYRWGLPAMQQAYCIHRPLIS